MTTDSLSRVRVAAPASVPGPRDTGTGLQAVIRAAVWTVVWATILRNIGSSIGVAIYPVDGANAAALIDAADGAMYRAKQGARLAS